MLDIRNAFIDFGKILQPPPDFEIDYAVATTYSLDLYALLSIPLAMYYRQNLDSEASEDNFQLLEAIQHLPKNLKIFCNKGKIALPKANVVSLIAFIEKCVVDVMPTSEKESFHPKVWVLRFKSTYDNSVCYRVIVMSRNLTFDKSYDVAYWMEGFTKSSKKNSNTDLRKFLKELDNHSPIQHKTFIQDLAKVKFELCDSFKEYNSTFLPSKNWKEALGLNVEYNRRMIISPFLSEKTVNSFREKTKEKLIVFSRKIELDKLSLTILKEIDAYCFEQEIVDHFLYENAEEGNGDEYNSFEWDNNLHAKLYLRENVSSCTEWDLGSANCTNSAFSENKEFMLHLKGTIQATSIRAIKDELTKEYNGVTVFKKYERPPNQNKVEKEPDYRYLEYLFLTQISNPDFFTAQIEKNEKRYDFLIRLNIPFAFTECKIKANPFGVNQSVQLIDGEEVRFENIPLHKLSSFVHWQVLNEEGLLFSLVTKVDVQNMPDYRLSNILKSIIDNPDKFMVLIMSLLTDEPLLNVSENNENGKITSFMGSGFSMSTSIPVYEELLLTLSRSPKRLLRLATIIEKLSDLEEDAIIPKEFIDLWNTIKKFLPND